MFYPIFELQNELRIPVLVLIKIYLAINHFYTQERKHTNWATGRQNQDTLQHL